uniref:Strictosidine synthase conserved region domain-containing protein n=1 Tax=Setaria italica TaxID=4555 RepID=K4ADX4_SETIT
MDWRSHRQLVGHWGALPLPCALPALVRDTAQHGAGTRFPEGRGADHGAGSARRRSVQLQSRGLLAGADAAGVLVRARRVRAAARGARAGAQRARGRGAAPGPGGPRVRRRRRVAVHGVRRRVGPESERSRRGRRGLGPDRGTPAWRRARGGRRPRRGQRGHRAAEGEPRRECGAIDGRGGGFALTDGVDIAADGTIYFTDASYKYNLANHMADVLETRPHGRLMSFDPSTGRTVVLVRDLYFVNGVAVAPDQSSLIYCETVM